MCVVKLPPCKNSMAMNTFVESWHEVLVYGNWGVRFSISGEMREQSASQHVFLCGTSSQQAATYMGSIVNASTDFSSSHGHIARFV